MATPSTSNSGYALEWGLSALLVVATVVVFGRSLQAEFVSWDDDINIYGNPHIQGLTGENLRWMFTDMAYVRRYMPLAWLGLACNHALFQLKPAGYHLSNILLHAGSAVLVFLVLRKLLLLGSSGELSAGRRRYLAWCAVLGALLWALHPLRVEAVAWASGHIYCQALLFLLMSCLAYLHFYTSPAEARGKTAFYWISVLSFAASLLTYPIGLSYPFVLIALDFYGLKGSGRAAAGARNFEVRRLLMGKVPFLIVLGLIFAVTWWARVQATEFWGPKVTLEQFGPFPRLMQAFYVWAYYLWKPWWPSSLAPVYTTLVWFKPTDVLFVVSAALVLALSFLLLWQRKRWPALCTLWLCYLALLVPVLGLTEYPHYTTDRYSYLVAILWSVLFAAVLFRLGDGPRTRVVALAVSLGLVGICGALSIRQTRVWQNSISLFEHALGTLGPNRYAGDIQWRLGLVLAEKGQWNEAIARYTAAVQLLPQFPEAHESLGAALEAQGQFERAAAHYENALRLQPNPDRHAKLALALHRQGRDDAALAHYRQAVRLKPDWADVLNNLAWMLAVHNDATLRNGSEAVVLAERACHLTGYRKARLVGTLAAAYAEAGRFAEAVETARQAVSLATASGEKELAATNRQLLELYLSDQAYHEPEGKRE